MRKGLIVAIVASLMPLMLCASVAVAEEGETGLVEQPAPTTQAHLVITEVQTGTRESAGQEYVKIYNPNATEVVIEGWKLQYRSAGNQPSEAWSFTAAAKTTFTCADKVEQPDCRASIPGRGTITLATSTYASIAKQYEMTSGLAQDGGQIRLVHLESDDAQEQLIVEDMVGYGTAATFEGTASAPAPAAGDVLLRRLDAETHEPIDTNDNKADFVLQSVLHPVQPTGQPVSGAATSTTEEDDDADEPDATITYPRIIITETLPDPASPAKDTTDEFVELYNPNETAVDLTGYALQAGTNWRYIFVLPELSLAPGSYIAVYSSQTKVTLSNSGTGVRVLDPNGEVVDELASYGKAKTGQSWAINNDGVWSWTTTLTPNAPNTLTATQTKAAKAATTTKPKAVIKQASATTKAKTPAGQSNASSDQPGPVGQAAQAAQPFGILFIGSAAAAAAGGYALYEYRTDIATTARRLYEKIKGKGNA